MHQLSKDSGGFWAVANDQCDGLEKNSVVSVVLVDRLRGCGGGQEFHEDLKYLFLERAIVGLLVVL